MLKKKKGNNPSNSGGSSGNHTSGSSKARFPASIQATTDLDNCGFDDSQNAEGCSNKTQIYSTTV
jgi:hypothetical protein